MKYRIRFINCCLNRKRLEGRGGKVSEELYTYAVARIRSKELLLFNSQMMETLLGCKDYEECIRMLQEKGWGNSESATAEEILSVEREKTWDLIEELVKDISVFDVFLYANDYHNLKAALKEAFSNKQIPDIYLSHGTIDVDLIKQAVKKHDFSELPKYMQDCARETYEVLFHTGDGQLCDIMIDKASLEAIYKKGKESKNDVIEAYAELKVACSDINIAIRGNKTKKEREFFQRALATCDSLDIGQLMEAAIDKEEAIYDYLAKTVYAGAVQNMKKSPSSFERWCDDMMINLIRPQKYNPFTLSPLAAYILGRENEIKSVRILLSGKLNDFPENSIRERLREMYV